MQIWAEGVAGTDRTTSPDGDRTAIVLKRSEAALSQSPDEQEQPMVV